MLRAYTEQLLEWQLGQPDAKDQELCVEDAALAQRTAQRLLRTAARAGHRQIVLLGVGDGTLATLIMKALGEASGDGLDAARRLLVLEDSPQRARQALLRCPHLAAVLVVDTSPWALLLLTLAGGLERNGCALVYNPLHQKMTELGLMSVLEQWRRLFLGIKPLTESLTESSVEARMPSLSLSCIAHPQESMLAEFMAQVPPWLAELVIVWDGAAPAQVPECAVPLRQVVRPLAGDFAAQRNAMLEACKSDWCLYLDVDEVLSATTWAALPHWMRLRMQGAELGAVALPRETFMGDSQHVRMGYGLWPDVQVRLFPLRPGLRFVGAVHEQLTGVEGPYCLAAGHALLHYSHVRKDRASLKARLQVFDAAGQTGSQNGSQTDDQRGAGAEAGRSAGAEVRHVLSAAYPVLPAEYFTALRETLGGDALLHLPVSA